MNGVVPNLWHCFMTYEVDHFPKQLITSVKFFEVTDISLPCNYYILKRFFLVNLNVYKHTVGRNPLEEME